MADAQALRDLAQEVERLDGFSRNTNNRIARAMGWRHLSKTASGRLHGAWLDPAEQHGINEGRTLHRDPPPWTGSIDAAAKLMPPHWRLANFQEEPPEIGGWRATGHRASPGIAIEGAAAKTAALTITALWLRALAADLEGTK